MLGVQGFLFLMPLAYALLTPPFFLEKGAGKNEENNVKYQDRETQKAKKNKKEEARKRRHLPGFLLTSVSLLAGPRSRKTAANRRRKRNPWR